MTTFNETTRQAVDSVGSLLAVVNLVRSGRVRTRPGLARALGLGRTVIAQRVDQAIDIGYLEESELGESTGGRAPRNLRFRAERGRIIVCALGALHIRVGVSDLDGTILRSDHREWDITEGPKPTLQVAQDMIDALLAGLDDEPTWGIAVGVPGPVDFTTGRPVSPPIMPGWDAVDIRGAFERKYHARTWVDNDVNLLALAERARRSDTKNLDLIYLKVGTGIGAAFLFDGQLHRGVSGAAGDIGHTPDRRDDSYGCRCGKTGCLEASAGGWALLRDADAALAAGEDSELRSTADARPLIPEDLALAARRFDQLALRLVGRSAERTGEAIAVLVNALNPSVVVTGGAISSANDAFTVPFARTIQEAALPLTARNLSIVHSQADRDEPIAGGNALVIEQLFERTFSDWFADGAPGSPKH
jgi:predicted NBD/HSP70 family sugar kinase